MAGTKQIQCDFKIFQGSDISGRVLDKGGKNEFCLTSSIYLFNKFKWRRYWSFKFYIRKYKQGEKTGKRKVQREGMYPSVCGSSLMRVKTTGGWGWGVSLSGTLWLRRKRYVLASWFPDCCSKSEIAAKVRGLWYGQRAVLFQGSRTVTRVHPRIACGPPSAGPSIWLCSLKTLP